MSDLDVQTALEDRVLYVTGEIKDDMAVDFDRVMRRLGAEDEEVEVVFNSGGGGIVDGLAMYDTIDYAQRSGTPVHGHVQGAALSMAMVVLQACSKRTMSKNSWLMFHKTISDFPKDIDISRAERDVVYTRRLEDLTVALLAKRSRLSAKQIVAMHREGEVYLSSKESLRYGFVDKVS